MQRYAHLATVAFVLAAASIASAETTVFSGATFDVLISEFVPVGDGTESLWAGTLTILNKSGNPNYNPSGFDGSDAFGYTGISGALHQQDAPFAETPTLDQPDFATDIDTHFLFDISDVLFISAPAETRGLSPSAEPINATGPWYTFAQTSFGDNLSGGVAVIGGATGPDWDLAYIVSQHGQSITLDFAIIGSGGGQDVSEHILTTFQITPEPSSLALLAFGAIVASRRKRK